MSTPRFNKTDRHCLRSQFYRKEHHIATQPNFERLRRLNYLNILSIRCYVAVVETGSFTSAARQMRVSPSSVTKYVKMIESVLDVAMINRTTRRISVTDAGARFYEECVGIISQIELAASVAALDKEMTGHLRLSVTPSFASGILNRCLPQFLHSYPGITLDVIVSSDVQDLVRARLDVAFIFAYPPAPKLEYIEIAQCQRILCASPKYLEAAGTPNTAEALQSHAGLSPRFSEQVEPWLLKTSGEFARAGVISRVFSNNGDLLRQACLQGAGIGLFFEFHVREDVRAGHLIHILNDHQVQPKTLYAVPPRRNFLRPQARALIEYVRNVCSESI